MKKMYTFWSFLLFACPLFAQKANVFDVFYDENRLNVLEAQEDTLWVGTSGSLVKRLLPDGTVLEVWDANNSPVQKTIRDIAVSKDGDQVALAHGASGLTLKNGNQWKTWSAEAILGASVTLAPSVLWVGFDNASRLCMWGNDYKLRYLDHDQWIIIEALNQNQYIMQLLNDPAGNLFCMTENKITGIVDDKLVVYQGLNNERFLYAAFDPNGHLFMFSENGYLLQFVTPNSYSKITLPTLSLPQFLNIFKVKFSMNSIGELILFTEKKIYRRKMSGESETKSLTASWFTSNSLPYNVASDRHGNIWYNSKLFSILQKITKELEQLDAPLTGFIKGTGLNMESGSPFFWTSNYGYLNRQHINDPSKNEYYFHNRQYYAYFAPTGKPNQMWIGSIDGLRLYDNGQFTFVEEEVANGDKQMFSILSLSDGKVMGSGQLNKKSVVKIYDPRSSSWTYHERGQEGLPTYFSLTDYCKDPKGDAWFTYENGFLNYKNNAWDSIRFEDTGLPFKYPNNFSITADGDMWTTRFDSIYRFDQREWTLNHVLECPLLGSNFSTGIQHLFTDSKGRLWASGGCNEPRLSMYDGLQWYHLDSKNSNLPNEFFLGQISEDIHGDLWIISSHIVRLRTKDFEVWQKKQQSAGLHLWPNPANDAFTLHLPQNASGHIELMDVQGRILLRKKILHNGEDVFFERGSLPNGLYFVRLQTLNGRVFVQKVVFH